MYTIYLTGMAGSGKSTLTSVLKKWYDERESNCVTLNLDPGAFKLPYEPDVDIRNYVNIEQIMEEYELGPNGALIAASDLIAVNLNSVKEELDDLKPDYILVDTPGQLELFAFKDSGPYIVNNLGEKSKIVLFLYDFTVASTPFNFLSTILLYSSLRLKLNLPQISVLNKIDLSPLLTKRLRDWCLDQHKLEEAITDEKNSERYLLAHGVYRTFSKLSLIPLPIPISSIRWDGISNLCSAISNILRGGEEYVE